MARPKIEIDENAVLTLAERGWSIRGIAAAFKVSPQSISKKYGAKIEEARQHGAQKLLDILWKRGVQEKSDRVLIHLADRIIGKVPTKIELTDQQVDEYIANKESDTTTTKVETNKTNH